MCAPQGVSGQREGGEVVVLSASVVSERLPLIADETRCMGLLGVQHCPNGFTTCEFESLQTSLSLVCKWRNLTKSKCP